MFVWPEISTDFLAGVVDPKSDLPSTYFVFDGSQILLNFDSENKWHPADAEQAMQFTARQSHYMGCMGGVNYYALEAELESDRKAGMRSLFGKVDHMTFSLAGRALQILDWFRSHQYCGRCGVAAKTHDKDRAMVCEACNIHSYPRLSPSIITLVHRGDEVLLARNHNFPEGMYSTLAGFVEPGESIEETVRREVKEEVGVAVGELEYLGSQPWPFPNSLMLGFLAEYESGDIVCQEEEIADAQWFPVNELPKIPGSVAISRWIIDTYLARTGAKA